MKIIGLKKLLNVSTFYFILFLLFLNCQNIMGQMNFIISTDQEYNDNPFRSLEANSEVISSYDLGAEVEIERFSVLYFGSYTTFNKSVDRDYYWHQFGVYNSSENSIYGVYAEQRLNKEESNYLNYINASGYYKHSLNVGTINWTLNSAVSVMNYENLSEFNNWVGSLGLSANKGFQTKTTLIGSLKFNYKGFKNYDSTQQVIENENSNGKGKGQGKKEQTTTYTEYTEDNVNVSQLEFNGRIAQSIFENTGLAFNFNLKKILSGSGFSASLIESTYGEFELYDDPLSQEGYSFGGIISQLLPEEIMVRLGFYYLDKRYPSQGIFISETEYDESFSRQDYQTNLSATASKSFFLSETGNSAITLTLSYGSISNISNSYYYNYKSNVFSLSASYQF